MLSKILGLVFVISLTITANAKSNNELKCADKAVMATVMKNFKSFSVSTNSCGIKLLNKGVFSETYIVCTTDETDTMEYVTVMDRNCKTLLVTSSNQGEAPAFENDNGLLNAVSCSADEGSGKLSCRK